jgi:small subunit ribosomal protein S6
MKRNYELMLVLSPELDETALETLIDRIKGFLDNAQAEILNFKSWGLRRMAYMIQGQREGRYYLVHFAGESENCSEIERNLILSEGVLRHLLTRADSIPAVEPDVLDAASNEDSIAESTPTQEEDSSEEETE